MKNINPLLLTDGYKISHHRQYPKGTTLVYSNFTPRSNSHAPERTDFVVSFGQQMVVQTLHELFRDNFFNLPKEQVIADIRTELSMYMGENYDTTHFEKLHDLGYLPICVKSLEEGTLVPIKVPVLTIYNTLPEFYWVTNFLETVISNLLWKPITSATIAYLYKQKLLKFARETDENNTSFVEWQGHDFSMRGLSGIDSVVQSGLGHLTSFNGSDSLPAIYGARKYYGEEGFVCGSVNASEHSVMCAGGNETELETFERLLGTFPNGILSVVSDTWDLWRVITEYLPKLKDKIMARDGKLVVRPDSGDPVDIICGLNTRIRKEDDEYYLQDFSTDEIYEEEGKYYEIEDDYSYGEYLGVRKGKELILKEPEIKGVVELLWDIFGGTVNSQGYKVLDPHIGCIYGDSITLQRAQEICERLKAKGFASTNVVLGIGSFTYQYNTRDTWGMAVKATYVEINGAGKEIFKDPITDSGTKKSAKGLLRVEKVNDYGQGGEIKLFDQQTWQQESTGLLKTIYKDGSFYNTTTLTEIKQKINSYHNQPTCA